MVLVLCTLSDHTLQKFMKISKKVSVIERTRFPIFKFSKGNNSVKV